ncbi:hypothetical protein SODALDRAFT_379443 [Sodiomyces alkalinus F11]|uniref:Uncharacterized protein n=1 Tax=Sodiomyces alkalinus (strain CBS 110278 / VKM F-3762 / F11) TaxID=1314773 RepID=A0A3N2PUR7_SODAK|nr:hypothetical protein SODALDRAFT_379443 [Sodiomyces alkalinus F11]ROT38249.1 hypothetical protein SODALDRAFT_379443 [Sodiomyces alkalinus F11]
MAPPWAFRLAGEARPGQCAVKLRRKQGTGEMQTLAQRTIVCMLTHNQKSQGWSPSRKEKEHLLGPSICSLASYVDVMNASKYRSTNHFAYRASNSFYSEGRDHDALDGKRTSQLLKKYARGFKGMADKPRGDHEFQPPIIKSPNPTLRHNQFPTSLILTDEEAFNNGAARPAMFSCHASPAGPPIVLLSSLVTARIRMLIGSPRLQCSLHMGSPGHDDGGIHETPSMRRSWPSCGDDRPPPRHATFLFIQSLRDSDPLSKWEHGQIGDEFSRANGLQSLKRVNGVYVF